MAEAEAQRKGELLLPWKEELVPTVPWLLRSILLLLGALAWGAGWKLLGCAVGEQLGLLAPRA